uniref:Uncharacterized protein n=1 Tax=Romanomermis culicivorax TaxID=13658 RepID=A0A915L045_ROMCU
MNQNSGTKKKQNFGRKNSNFKKLTDQKHFLKQKIEILSEKSSNFLKMSGNLEN